MLWFHSKAGSLLGDNSPRVFIGYLFDSLLKHTPLDFYVKEMGLSRWAPWISLVLFIMALLFLFRDSQRNVSVLKLYLLSVILSHLAFAILNLYPIGNRFSIDLIPVFAAAVTLIEGQMLAGGTRSAIVKLAFMAVSLTTILFNRISVPALPVQWYDNEKTREMAQYLSDSGLKKVFLFGIYSPQYTFYGPGLRPKTVMDKTALRDSIYVGSPVVLYEDVLLRMPEFRHLTPDTVFKGRRNLAFFREFKGLRPERANSGGIP
jgi:hypothetical protein